MISNKTAYHQWLQDPLYPPPPGVVVSTTAAPSSLQKYDILCQTLCLTIVTTLVAVRIHTKSRILKTFGWDDCRFFTPLRLMATTRLTLVCRHVNCCMGRIFLQHLHRRLDGLKFVVTGWSNSLWDWSTRMRSVRGWETCLEYDGRGI